MKFAGLEIKLMETGPSQNDTPFRAQDDKGTQTPFGPQIFVESQSLYVWQGSPSSTVSYALKVDGLEARETNQDNGPAKCMKPQLCLMSLAHLC